jgi:uncharacterized protein with PQ loop repeat
MLASVTMRNLVQDRRPAGTYGLGMTSVLGYAPIAATAFGVPQFLPQMLKLRATRDTAGISWSWAALTAVNNAAWIGYFALSRYWTALVPSCSVTVLAGALTVMLTGRAKANRRSLTVIGTWAATLAVACFVAGRVGLGTLLTAAFVVQVAPSLWTAFRTARPSGVSAGTWALILGELACFLIYGVYESDPRLITLGSTGVIASTLMLARIYWTVNHAADGQGKPTTIDATEGADGGGVHGPSR